ncbi:acyl-CoA dehydrogenase family protein [Dokdonia ponticola]|uniref:Acyl-CoA dehydrogenase family protein n=1 Tax=Dokdonia ponticola TaxID=2041041 RepID=A0ABV9HYE5_9FLAO
MTYILTKQQITLKKEIIAFSQSELNAGVEDRDRNETFDRLLWKKCGDLKLQGLCIPEMYGGRGLDFQHMVIALEALGYGCTDNGLSFSIGAHLLACTIPILKYGSETQKREYLPMLCGGSWIATNAITEQKSGSDVFKMSSIAHKVKNGYILNGEKNYCTNAPVADLAVVYAMTNEQKGALGGISSFILEKKYFETSDKIEKMGLRTALMGDITFKDSELPNSTLIGKEGAGTVQFTKSMMWERVGLSAIHIGTLQRLLDEVVVFVKERKISNQSIIHHQSIGHKLADIRTTVEAGKLLIAKAAFLIDNNLKANTAASMAKLYVSELYKNATSNILQIYGASGYIKNSDIARSLRDAQSSTIYSGTSEIQKNLILRSL